MYRSKSFSMCVFHSFPTRRIFHRPNKRGKTAITITWQWEEEREDGKGDSDVAFAQKREKIICQKGYVKKSNYSWLTFASAEGAFLLLKLDTSDSRRPIHAQEDFFLFLFFCTVRETTVCVLEQQKAAEMMDVSITKRKEILFFHKAQKRSLFLVARDRSAALVVAVFFFSSSFLAWLPCFFNLFSVPLRVAEKRLRSKSSFSSLIFLESVAAQAECWSSQHQGGLRKMRMWSRLKPPPRRLEKKPKENNLPLTLFHSRSKVQQFNSRRRRRKVDILFFPFLASACTIFGEISSCMNVL